MDQPQQRECREQRRPGLEQLTERRSGKRVSEDWDPVERSDRDEVRAVPEVASDEDTDAVCECPWRPAAVGREECSRSPHVRGDQHDTDDDDDEVHGSDGDGSELPALAAFAQQVFDLLCLGEATCDAREPPQSR